MDEEGEDGGPDGGYGEDPEEGADELGLRGGWLDGVRREWGR